jgi:hypothetical protein
MIPHENASHFREGPGFGSDPEILHCVGTAKPRRRPGLSAAAVPLIFVKVLGSDKCSIFRSAAFGQMPHPRERRVSDKLPTLVELRFR